MEASMASEVINRNANLDKMNAQITTVIADDDAATISTIRKEALHEVQKWSDLNHATSCFVKAIRKVPSVTDQQTIDHLEYMFSIAIRSHQNDEEGVRKALLAFVPHCFDDHTSCQEEWWGFFKNPREPFVYKHLPKNKPLSGETKRAGLVAVFQTYAAAAARLAPLGSSQVNEAFNQVATSKHPKRVHYGRSESMPFRIAATVCQFNEGTSYVSEVQKKLEISPGEHTVKFRASKDRKRSKKAARIRTTLFKTNRITKKKARKYKRLGCERSEGVTYSSGCGFEIPHLGGSNDLEDSADDPIPLPDLPVDFYNVDNSHTAYVIFDVETTGFGKSA